MTHSTGRKATSTPRTFYWIGALSASYCLVRTSRAASAFATCLFWRRYGFMGVGSCSVRILPESIGGGTNDETSNALDDFCIGRALFELLGPNRQSPDPCSSCCKNRVRDRGNNRRHRWFAHFERLQCT